MARDTNNFISHTFMGINAHGGIVVAGGGASGRLDKIVQEVPRAQTARQDSLIRSVITAILTPGAPSMDMNNQPGSPAQVKSYPLRDNSSTLASSTGAGEGVDNGVTSTGGDIPSRWSSVGITLRKLWDVEPWGPSV